MGSCRGSGSRPAQYDAIVEWGIPDHGALQRLTGIRSPTLIIQGDDDRMIPTKLSHLMAGLIPDARIRIYDDAAHAFVFQYPAAGRRRCRRVPRLSQGGDDMSDTQVNSDAAEAAPATVPLRFEVAVLPVADVDRAKAFYERLGWRLDADFPIDERFRIVQFTPPGSPASIQFGTGVTTMEPGSVKDMYLVVDDLQAARDELISRGADVSEIWHGRGLGTEGHEPGPDPAGQSYGSFASFSDPDGNRYLLQEITERLPGRK